MTDVWIMEGVTTACFSTTCVTQYDPPITQVKGLH
jgi:hypothetical protein